MKITFGLLTVFILLLASNCQREDVKKEIEQFLEMARQKLRQLERAGHIKRDNISYTEPEITDGEAYDFIIVGAGSTGSALVRRLTEITKWKVLLLEAGGEPDMLSEIPLISPLTYVTDLNWKYFSEKEPNLFLGLEDQRMRLHRGKGLGGSSLINFMIYARGAKEDYDKWASLGNPGWSYEDVLPIFERLENCTVRYRDDMYRGHSGPVEAADTHTTKSADVFIQSAEKLRYQYVDYNGRTNRGVSRIQANLKRGLRCSGELCYIRPVKNRRNLTIRLRSRVTKILIKDNTAYGVEFYKNGRFYRAYANKEIILSAGAFGSPHILLLSGIGPQKQLRKFGIKPIKDLPVGQKMYDHVAYYGLGFTVNDSIVFNLAEALADEAFIRLYNEGKGLLTTMGTDNILFTKTPLACTSATDLEILFVSSGYNMNRRLSLAGTMGMDDETYDSIFKPYEGQFSVNSVPILLHPESYGYLELQSADPFVYPKIYSRYFTDPQRKDIRTIISGIREAIRLVLSPPFDKYGTKMMDRPMPGCQMLKYDSDQYWECAITHLSSTIHHHSTTCKMGPENDPEAVVDPRLKVYGIHDLRVADTSIFPTTVSGHTNVPAYMVGEKAADIIKEDYFYELY